MRSKMRILGLKFLLLAVLLVGFGCELPGTGSTTNNTGTGSTGGTGGTGGFGGTGGTTGGGTTGGSTGGGTATYTANGTYTYNLNTLTLIVSSSNFPSSEGPSGTETITVNSLTATQMSWTFTDGSNDTMMWSRTNGTAGNLNGTWNGMGGDNDSIVLTMNNGAWNVVVTSTSSGTGGTTGGTTGGISGTWEGTYTENFPVAKSGTVRFTFYQTNNYISGTGFTQEFGTGYTNNTSITAGTVNGNTLGMTLMQTGSDGYNSWTITTQVSGTINGNTISGNYKSDQTNPPTFSTGTFTITKKY